MRHAGECCTISPLSIVRATTYDVCGCKLSILPENIKNAPHHFQTYASVFFHNRRLYQIEGTVPAGGSTADGTRFQKSLDFTDGWRLPDALRNELRAR